MLLFVFIVLLGIACEYVMISVAVVCGARLSKFTVTPLGEGRYWELIKCWLMVVFINIVLYPVLAFVMTLTLF